MKKTCIKVVLMFCSFVLLTANDEVNATQQAQNEIPAEIEQIAKERKSEISDEQIDEIKDPFTRVKPESATVVPNFELSAIVGNSVRINGVWHKLNEDIEQYKLVKIESRQVILNDPNTDTNVTIELKRGNNVTISFN